MARIKKKSKKAKEAAMERVRILFQEAEGMVYGDSALANRYVELARKIAMKNKVKHTSELKRKVCKKCHSYLLPSLNCRVRVHDRRVIYTCLICNHSMRFPYIKEQDSN